MARQSLEKPKHACPWDRKLENQKWLGFLRLGSRNQKARVDLLPFGIQTPGVGPEATLCLYRLKRGYMKPTLAFSKNGLGVLSMGINLALRFLSSNIVEELLYF